MTMALAAAAAAAAAAAMLVLKNKQKILMWMDENRKHAIRRGTNKSSEVKITDTESRGSSSPLISSQPSQVLNHLNCDSSSSPNSAAEVLVVHNHLDLRSGTAAAACIPSDAMLEILSRLPVKSIFRFRSVCKGWRSLTYQPYFHEQYNRRSYERLPSILVPSEGLNLQIYELGHDNEIRKCSQINSEDGVHVTNNANGLVALYRQLNMNCFYYCLLNPSTCELSESFKIGCEGSAEFVALGFDSSSGNYKLVSFCANLGATEYSCMVLTVGSKDWRFVGVVPYKRIVFKPFFLNGALYWMVASGLKHVDIIAMIFDIKEEKFRSISTPVSCSSEDYTPIRRFVLRAFHGQICFVATPIRSRHSSLKIWILKDGDIPEWKLEHTIHVSPAFSHQMNSVYAHIIDIRGGKILMQRQPYIFSYDVESKDCRIVYEHARMPMLSFLYLTMENFVSPKKVLSNSVV